MTNEQVRTIAELLACKHMTATEEIGLLKICKCEAREDISTVEALKSLILLLKGGKSVEGWKQEHKDTQAYYIAEGYYI